MASQAQALVSIEEYLSNPAYEHFEYVDGQVVELNVGSKPHSRIQVNCCVALSPYVKTRQLGYVATELHCRLRVSGRLRFRLPDVAVVLGPDDASESRFLDRAPDLVIEIRSPDDSLTSQIRKIDEYFANGAKLAWLILPEERSVMIFTPNAPVRTALPGETLDGGELLPDLRVPVDDLFS